MKENTDRLPNYDRLTLPIDPFPQFEARHEQLNRFFWSTDVCYHVAVDTINSLSATKLVQQLISPTDERRYTFRRYLSRHRENAPGARATIADFDADLKTNSVWLLQAVIVAELSNLETFLRKWTEFAVRMELASRTGRYTAVPRKTQLVELTSELQRQKRMSMTLSKLASYFPAAVHALKTTTHKRTRNPFLSVPLPGASCLDVAQMWREIRNLLLHREGRCDEAFVNEWATVWDVINDDIAKDGLRSASRGLIAGKRLPLNKRHAVYCFTTCHQTAYVFHLAASDRSCPPGTS